MSFFNEVPPKPLGVALRLYWLPFVLLILEPFAALLLATTVDLPGIRAATAIPAFLFALWPAALKDAPATYWLLACVCWFTANFAVLAVSGGVAGAQQFIEAEAASRPGLTQASGADESSISTVGSSSCNIWLRRWRDRIH